VTPRRRLTLSWALVGLVVLVAFAAGSANTDPPTPAERVQRLAGEFACPTCDGQAVRDSDALVSQEIRAEIARRVEVGETDEQVRAALAAAYGAEFLLTPAATGAASLVWVLPVAVFLGGLAAVGAVVVRGRPRSIEVSAADRDLVDRARHGDPRSPSADG
jgi:cytochrome c-type biogenesis protein CcmH/NrfF